MKRRVDQKQIVDALGVAPATVSKVLNHDPFFRVSPKTREMILKTAREMGYERRRRHTGNIALVIASEMTVGCQELYKSVSEIASKSASRVFLVNTPRMPSYRDIAVYANPLTCDGVLLEGDISDKVISRVASIIPTVLLDEREHKVQVDRIYSDFTSLTERLMAHLLELGHREIALVVWDLDEMISKSNVAGYRNSLESAGVQFDSSLVWETSSCRIMEVIKGIIDHPAKPTAILDATTEDHLVMLNGLDLMGYGIPEDISYIGWDTTFYQNLRHFPELTRLDGYWASLAKVAFGRLTERMADELLPKQDIRIDPPIMAGGTCGPVQKEDRFLGSLSKRMEVSRPPAKRTLLISR